MEEKKKDSYHTTSGVLDATPPFDFVKSVEFIDAFPPMHGEQERSASPNENNRSNGNSSSSTSPILTKAIMLDGQTIAFRLSSEGTMDTPRVRYDLISESPIGSQASAYVAGRISFFLSLKDDLKPFYRIAEDDPKFYPIVKEYWGLHHVKFLTLLEIACWAILTQRAAIPIARYMKRAIVEKYGGSIEVDGVRYQAFPDNSRLRAVTLNELISTIKNVRKAEYLSYLITAFRGVDEEFLRTGKYEDAEEWLKDIRGIGDWSAAFILLRGLGRMERLPFNLQPILRRLDEVYGPGQMTMKEIAQRYGQWIGYWSYYLRTSA